LQTLNYKCEFCGKLFAKEKTLIVHICEQKRRHLSKTEKHVQAGLLTYQRFYEITQSNKSSKSFDDFASSPYYTAFVKFGSFLINTSPIYPERFINLSVDAIPMDNKYYFPYKINRGHSYLCIAIELLDIKDFPKDIIDNAIKMKNKICMDINK
jgi:hypothetical protein